MDASAYPVEDPYNLRRFVAAQDANQTYGRVLAELRAGRKTSHWMWFIFPQLAGLGRSSMSRRYAICSPAEARAFVAHPVLGGRLRECASILLALEDVSAESVFGTVDAIKLRSSMRLFAQADGGGSLFIAVLVRFFDSVEDEAAGGAWTGN